MAEIELPVCRNFVAVVFF